jgi:hypothetical protein
VEAVEELEVEAEVLEVIEHLHKMYHQEQQLQ